MDASVVICLVASIVLTLLLVSNLRLATVFRRLFPPRTTAERDEEHRDATTSLCKLACETAGRYESETVFRHLACSVLRPSRSSAGTVTVRAECSPLQRV